MNSELETRALTPKRFCINRNTAAKKLFMLWIPSDPLVNVAAIACIKFRKAPRAGCSALWAIVKVERQTNKTRNISWKKMYRLLSIYYSVVTNLDIVFERFNRLKNKQTWRVLLAVAVSHIIDGLIISDSFITDKWEENTWKGYFYRRRRYECVWLEFFGCVRSGYFVTVLINYGKKLPRIRIFVLIHCKDINEKRLFIIYFYFTKYSQN